MAAPWRKAEIGHVVEILYRCRGETSMDVAQDALIHRFVFVARSLLGLALRVSAPGETSMSRRTSRIAALGAATALAVATGLSQAQSTGGEGFGDFVWNDLNQNGIQDALEPGLPGVVVNLFSSSNSFATPVVSDTTDAAGNYLLDLGTSGNISFNFYVQFVLPAGFVFSPPNVGGLPNDSVDSDVTNGNGAGTTDTIPGFNLPASGGPLLTVDAGMFERTVRVPEPGTLAILAPGLIALAWRMRRQRPR